MSGLILHPDFRDPGGVASYYRKLKGRFSMPVEHYIVGTRADEKGVRIVRMIMDYGRFLMRLRKSGCDIVHVNPSLDPKSFLRDGLFLLLSRMFKKRTVVFFHGWHKSFEQRLEQKGLWLFRYLYGKTDAFIVLSEEFKRTLESWGCTQSIYLEVTVTDDQALRGFDVQRGLSERMNSRTWRILFLSRVEVSKGIYETIQAFSILQGKYPKMELVVAGDGNELDRVKAYVRNHAVPNITFTGYVTGEEKKKVLETAHILCFPTYGEGLPNVVIEAMAFGLPVVTRPVGGLADLFEDGGHGFVTNSKKAGVFAHLMETLFLDGDLYREISLHNYSYAQSNFRASDAALRLERIYEAARGL